MQWNCPHCGVNLSVTDDTLGTGWSFSRCFKCGGFGLVRKTEINIIKVDKAPPGERIILPEETADPSKGLLSEAATQRLTQLQINSQKKDKAESIRTGLVPPPPPNFAQTSALNNETLSPTEISYDITDSKLPDTLPDSLLNSAVETEAFPNPSQRSSRFRFIPAGVTLASIAAITSGSYFFMQAQNLWHRSQDTSQEVAQNTASETSIVSDEVQHSAMAPVKALNSGEASTPEQVRIQVKTEKAPLYSGPGNEFQVLGFATLGARYRVAESNEHWLKLLIQGPHAETFGWLKNEHAQILTQ